MNVNVSVNVNATKRKRRSLLVFSFHIRTCAEILNIHCLHWAEYGIYTTENAHAHSHTNEYNSEVTIAERTHTNAHFAIYGSSTTVRKIEK